MAMNDTATKTCPSCLGAIDSRASRCQHCAQRQPDVGLHRDVPGKAIGGVCAALSQHFNVDLTLLRVLFIASIAFTGGLVFWVYFATWLMTPFEANGRSPATKAIDWLGNLFSPRTGGVESVK